MSTLAELTTLRVGGPAERLVEATTATKLADAVRDAWARESDWLVLGGGSNILVADTGVAGTVILSRAEGITVLEATAHAVRVRVEAGEPWDRFVATAVQHGWSGVEALSGIPGTVGASPVQNIGAYGAEVADVIESIDFLDEDSGERTRVAAEELGFGYRTSALKRGRRGVVLSVDFRLGRGSDGGVTVRHDQLARSLDVEVGDLVAPAMIRDRVLRLRSAKGMVLDPDDTDTWSAGSFFTNPVVGADFALSLPSEVPQWRTEGADRVKLSAAWLIEHAGVPKGFALPGSRAAVSSKHTLALTNRGGATAGQIAELARYIQTVVMNRYGVGLVPEPVIVGDFTD